MSSILETFFFLFESDAKKLDDGLKKSESDSEKLEKSLKDTDKAADMVGGSMLDLAKKAGFALGSLLAFSTVKATVLEVAGAIDDLGDAAAALDIPVEDFSAWSMAATMSDGSQEGFIGSLNQINAGFNDIATKGKGRLLPFLKEMGLSLKDVEAASKDPLSALLKMSDQFQKLTRAEAAGLGSKLGLDQGTINLLSRGRVGIEELIHKQKELGVVTTAQVEAAAKFDDAMKEWNATLADVKRKFVTEALPPLTEFLKMLGKIVGWMMDHKGLVITFFTAVAAVLTAVYLPAMISAAAATWALIAPYVAIGAAVAAFAAILALVAEDLYAFQSGQDSAIGELAKKWPIIGDAIKMVGTVLTWLLATADAVFSSFVALIIGGPQAAIDNFVGKIRFLLSEVSTVFPTIGGIFTFLADSMTSNINMIMTAWDWLISKISAGINLFMRGVDAMANAQEKVAGIFGFQFTSPARAMAGALTAPARAVVENAPTGLRIKPDPLRSPATTPKSTPPADSPAIPGARTVPADTRRPPVAQTAPKAAPAAAPVSTKTVPADTRRPVAQTVPNAAPAVAPIPAKTVPAEQVRTAAVADRAPSPATRAAVGEGKAQLTDTNSPIVAQSSSAIANTDNRSVTKTTTVEIAKIEIQTQATDADGVSRAVGQQLGDQLTAAINQNDDGVIA